ncbi:MAG: damage-inducible protein DinB [Acidobacteria bacterium]|nr:MAG: damage-inducible protein DinB [Acidobacteriota bacterium]
MRKRSALGIFVLGLAVGSTVALAQPAAAPAMSGLRAEVVNELSSVEKQIVSLAEAIPAEKYAWRPSEGIRSVGEVYVHIAAGNYLLGSMLGVKRPENTGPDMEKKITDKAKIIPGLKASFDYARKAVEGLSDADLEKKVDFFGRSVTERSILLRLLDHAHEHLGQSIAYARMNGITPPWSEAPAAEKKAASR